MGVPQLVSAIALCRQIFTARLQDFKSIATDGLCLLKHLQWQSFHLNNRLMLTEKAQKLSLSFQKEKMHSQLTCLYQQAPVTLRIESGGPVRERDGVGLGKTNTALSSPSFCTSGQFIYSFKCICCFFYVPGTVWGTGAREITP